VREALRALAEEAWAQFEEASARAPEIVVSPSVPILYFGDSKAYARAPLKVITVGLNPSLKEFPSTDPWLRFPGARANGARPSVEGYLDSLDAYFRTRPYRGWFDPGFEPILRGIGASYYSGAALHTDIASPVATNPTWSGLKERRALVPDGAALWRELVEVLAPDVLLISVARRHLRHLGEVRWRVFHIVERENPYEVLTASAVIGGRDVPVFFGRCVNIPFGSVAAAEKERIGSAIRGEVDGG
jgi:hypothetical protein